MCVCGAVDGGDGGVRNPAASRPVALQRAGGEQQVESFFLPPTTPSILSSSPLLLPVVGVGGVVLLRLQLKAQGGVEGDDAAAGGNRKFQVLTGSRSSLETTNQAGHRECVCVCVCL